jgi:lambda family phage tail tape measure protein
LRDKQQTANAYSPDAGKTSTFAVVQPGGKGNAPQAAAQIAAAEAELADARRKQFRETENAYAESLNAQINKEGIAASSAVDGWLKRGKAASMYKQELDKLNRDFDKAALAGTPVSTADKQVALAAVKKQYTDSGAARNANRIDKAQLGLDVEKIKASLSILTSSYMNAENILEAQRAAGLIGEKAYYDQKRKLIQDQGVAETKGLEDEASRLKASKATGADALEVQKKLVDVQAQITIAKANTTTKVTTLDIQQKNSLDQVTRSYAEARIAAQDYLDTMSRGIDREVEAFPRGDKERNRVSARQQIEDRYTQQRLELENNKRLLEMQKDPDTGASKFTSEARDKYNNQLAILDEYQAKALVKWDAGYKAIGALESDWSTGAQRAMENYVDTAANASKLSEGLFTNAFQSMEDAIVQFATTGKLSFGDLARSIIADMARVQAKNLLASLIGGNGQGALGGGISGFLQQWATKSAIGTSSSPTNGMGIMGDVLAGARAAGGPVNAGSRYLVGERGAEVFSPDVSGTIIPNSALGGGDFKVIVNNYGNDKVETRPLADGAGVEVFINAIKNSIGEDIAYGTGPVNAALKGRYGLRETV